MGTLLVAQLAIIFGVIIGIVHYYSDKIYQQKFHKKEILSFAAGVSITYLLLILLPELYEGVQELQKLLFLFVLFGASLFHLIEKYLYQHENKRRLIKDLSIVHAISFFTYHLILGTVLVSLLQKDILMGSLFFIPIITYTAVGQVSLKEIHAKVTEKKVVRIFLAASTLIGIIEAIIITIAPRILYALMGFVAGAMLYHVMRESIPSEKEGNGLFFLLGASLYTIFILIMWSI